MSSSGGDFAIPLCIVIPKRKQLFSVRRVGAEGFGCRSLRGFLVRVSGQTNGPSQPFGVCDCLSHNPRQLNAAIYFKESGPTGESRDVVQGPPSAVTFFDSHSFCPDVARPKYNLLAATPYITSGRTLHANAFYGAQKSVMQLPEFA